MMTTKSVNKTNTFVIVAVIMVIAGAALGDQANTVGAISLGDGEPAYVRVFSAKIADGMDKRLDELETIARERGSEEVVVFPRSVGPETPIDRWVVSLGSKEYTYPGLTVKWRTYMNEQRQLDRERKFSTFSLNNDETKAVQALPEMNTHLEWTLPLSVQSPLLCDISIDNKLVAMNTIYERLSPDGDQRWPDVIRIDLPQKDASVVQVFEYLDRMPDGLLSFHDGSTEGVPSGITVEELASDPLSEPLYSDGMGTRGAGPVEHDNVVFDYSWGFHYDKDTGWQPGGDFPAQIRLTAGANANISSKIWGDFQLSQQSLTNGQLKVGSGHGTLGMGFGVYLSARGYLDLVVWDKTFDIPGIPQVDLECEDVTSFNSYLLDRTASVSGRTGKISLFETGWS
ncbi:hypothetical protein ACFL5Z_21305, partial [Planctomycetota bacterium]